MEKREHLIKLQKFYKNLADHSIEDEGLDNALRNEGIDPTELVNDGMKKIFELRRKIEKQNADSLIVKIKSKINDLENKFSKATLEKFENWLPQLNDVQLSQVYRSIDDKKEDFNLDDSLKKLKKDKYIQSLMKDIDKT